MNEKLKNELRKDLPEGEGVPVSIETAESIILGIDPASDATPEEKEQAELATNPDDWTPEQREKVEGIMKMLTPPEPEPETDLRKHFKAGQTFRDPRNVRMVIRTVGKQAMNISILDRNGQFVDGHGISLGGFLFVTHRSKKRDTTFLLRGIQQQAETGATDSARDAN